MFHAYALYVFFCVSRAMIFLWKSDFTISYQTVVKQLIIEYFEGTTWLWNNFPEKTNLKRQKLKILEYLLFYVPLLRLVFILPGISFLILDEIQRIIFFFTFFTMLFFFLSFFYSVIFLTLFLSHYNFLSFTLLFFLYSSFTVFFFTFPNIIVLSFLLS